MSRIGNIAGILLGMYALIMAHNLIPHCHQDTEHQHSHQHHHHHEEEDCHNHFWLSFLFDHHGSEGEDEAHLDELQPSTDLQLKQIADFSTIIPTIPTKHLKDFQFLKLVYYQPTFIPSFRANSPPPLLPYGLRAPPAAVNV